MYPLIVVNIELCRTLDEESVKYRHDSVTHEILHGGLAGLVDVLHKLQDVVCEAIYDCYSFHLFATLYAIYHLLKDILVRHDPKTPVPLYFHCAALMWDEEHLKTIAGARGCAGGAKSGSRAGEYCR